MASVPIGRTHVPTATSSGASNPSTAGSPVRISQTQKVATPEVISAIFASNLA